MSQIKNQAPKTRMVDADKDGQIDSHHGVGCMVICHTCMCLRLFQGMLLAVPHPCVRLMSRACVFAKVGSACSHMAVKTQINACATFKDGSLNGSKCAHVLVSNHSFVK
jgi:hypothetical protein